MPGGVQVWHKGDCQQGKHGQAPSERIWHTRHTVFYQKGRDFPAVYNRPRQESPEGKGTKQSLVKDKTCSPGERGGRR